MAVKFPLKMPDGTAVRTIEELREHFDLRTVLDYYSNGRLAEWLEERYYDEEVQKVRELDMSSEKCKEELCAVLGVPYMERMDMRIKVGDVVKKNERRERLKKYTTDDEVLSSIDNVAFTQKELMGLLKRLDSLEVDDEDNRVIYLCGEHFIIPADVSGVIYKGVNNPAVKFDAEIIESGIDLQDVICDVSCYVEDGNYEEFFAAFDNNLLLGTKLLRQAAEKGNVNAQFVLGVCFMDGNGVEEDWEESEKWFQKAAEHGNVDANVLIYTVFNAVVADGTFAREGAKWLKKAVEQDSLYASIARNKLAEWYMRGIGVEQDCKEAVKYLKRAVKDEDVRADLQYYLGVCYFNGEGIQQDYGEAVKWLQKAVDRAAFPGEPISVDAMVLLGKCFQSGYGVEKDERKAVKFYQQAADYFNSEAEFLLGTCYLQGIGIEEDIEKAIKWMQRGVDNGFENDTTIELLNTVKEMVAGW